LNVPTGVRAPPAMTMSVMLVSSDLARGFSAGSVSVISVNDPGCAGA
jgi:hypothetical protein